MNPLHFALCAAILRSANDLLYRSSMRSKEKDSLLISGDPFITTFCNCLIGGVTVLAILKVPDLSRLPLFALCFLSLSGILWTFQVFLSIKSYQTLDVSTSSLLDAFSFILLNISGFFLFNEPISSLKVIGLAITFYGMIFGIHLSRLHISSGLKYKLAAVICGCVAFSSDKLLTSYIPKEPIILAGFFIPVFLCLLIRPACFSESYKALKSAPFFLPFTSVAMGVIAICLTFAFSAGNLSTTMTIYRASLAISFILGVIILKERYSILRRSIGAFLCVLGIALFCQG
jgi:uncharacterized membrane protein